MQLSAQQVANFRERLWEYYAIHGRGDLPWRQAETDGSFDPYKILVSELMLQQTQVQRVIPKYHAFLEQFANTRVLAAAGLGDVLRVWQGLGYSRRAKFLWQAAKTVGTVNHFPNTLESLVALPGVGKNTAGAMMAYAYDQPVLYIETNIRTVYIYHFFGGRDAVDDKEILELLGQTLEQETPREFYWALMDYGSHLKTTVGNLSRASKHFTKQSAFDGSRRQVRGQVLRLLGDEAQKFDQLAIQIPDDRLESVLVELVSEGMVRMASGTYTLD
jgi:A/G-specific adenine glycosylase